MTKIYGHRGAKGTYPENTLLGFSKAIKQGVDGLELDVHLTKEGEVVVIHDETLERTTTGKGWIKDLTLADIKKVSAGSSFTHLAQYGKEWDKEQVPTLQEVLELLAPYAVELNIELKTYAIAYDGIEEKVHEIVQNYGRGRKVIFSSFHLPSILRMKKINPHANIAWLLNEGISLPNDYMNTLQLESLHLNKSILFSRPKALEQMRELSDKLRIWTVNEPNEIKTLLELQVNAIITDYPERAISFLQENGTVVSK